MKSEKYIPYFLRYLILIFLTVMLITGMSRLYLILKYKELLPNNSFSWALESILQGLQFDSMIASSVIALPLLILSILFLFKVNTDSALRLFKYLFYLLFLAVIVLVVADLPFFEYYNSRLSKGILSWADSPEQMFAALIDEDFYYVYYLLGAILILIVFYLNNFLFNRYRAESKMELNFIQRLTFFMVFGLAIFIGLRGSADFKDKPLTTEKAFFSNSAFLNQMAMNPIFNFFDSFRYSDLTEETDEEAVDFVRKQFKIDLESTCSPINRKIACKDSEIKPSVVLILVESLSAAKVSIMKEKEKTTPTIDSLAENGLFFSNFYSNGVHTYNGIFSSLYGLPVAWNKKPLSDSYLSQIAYSGLPVILKEKGYFNSFFCTGDSKFDNMEGFLLNHGFDKIFSRESYRKEDIYNAWGLSDHKLYDYFYDYMNANYKKKAPLFTSLLTVSSHHGYDPPCVEDFTPISNNYYSMPYEFADWSLRRFFKKASQMPWFNNTIFIIVGDHGQNFNPKYEVPIDYVHVPMIIYAPQLIATKEIESPGMQIDIFPTVMGLLNAEYQNNTLGIDLLKEKRPYAYFSSDDYLGCIDENFYFLMGKSGREVLYDLRNEEQVDVSKSNIERTKEMKKYVVCMTQTSQFLMNSGMTGICRD